MEFTGVHLVDSVVVGTNMGCNEILDLVIGNQFAHTHFGIGGIIADDGEVLDPLFNQCVD